MRPGGGGLPPAYLYIFRWRTPILDGRPRAFHCADIPFAFFNTDRCDSMTGGGSRARELSAQIADAFVSFARTGHPHHAGLPTWAPFDSQSRACMAFDSPPRLEFGADSEKVRSLALGF